MIILKSNQIKCNYHHNVIQPQTTTSAAGKHISIANSVHKGILAAINAVESGNTP